MQILLSKYLRRLSFRMYSNAWLTLSIIITGLYTLGYVGMWLSDETQILAHYSWWFIVTITTVGYGDFSPQTNSGQTIAGFIMILGIGAIGLIIGKLSEFILDLSQKRMKGLGYMNLTDHTILMGYRKGSTEQVITELLANNPDEHIVICSESQVTHPLPDTNIGFVQGELSSEDVLQRSCASDAANVIIHGEDDNQTFFAAYVFRSINTHAHMVCYLNNESHRTKILGLPVDQGCLNQVLLPSNVYLMAQELQDRESSDVIQQLISTLDGENLYRTNLGDDFDKTDYLSLMVDLKKKFNATLIAVKSDTLLVNPNHDFLVCPGMAIFYASAHRIKI